VVSGLLHGWTAVPADVRNQHTDGTRGLVAHLMSHFDIAYGGASVFKVMAPAGRTP